MSDTPASHDNRLYYHCMCVCVYEVYARERKERETVSVSTSEKGRIKGSSKARIREGLLVNSAPVPSRLKERQCDLPDLSCTHYSLPHPPQIARD